MTDSTSDTTYTKVVSTTDVTSTTVSNSVDDVLAKTSLGSVDSAISNNIYGINHRQTPNAIQINKDYYGLTFFTRPELNLTTLNLRSLRTMIPLLTENANSIQRIIRCLLDKRLATSTESITSPLMDNSQAFIPMLTNNLLSMSGWPDVIAPTMTSTEGAYKESFSLIDGVTTNYSTYDIQANFRNIPGDPITALFLVWLHYASAVYQGIMVPYPDKIIQNEVDYETRIYRLVLDSTKRVVKKIAACGAAFPTSAPIGAAFNFESDRPVNNSNDQISIPFRCMGAMYQDDILIYEFNKVVAKYNPALANSNFTSVTKTDSKTNEKYIIEVNSSYTEIPIDSLALFNNRGYPRINPNNYELGWWVSNSYYKTKLAA